MSDGPTSSGVQPLSGWVTKRACRHSSDCWEIVGRLLDGKHGGLTAITGRR